MEIDDSRITLSDDDRRLMLAGMALQGWLASPNGIIGLTNLAREAFKYADALLKYHEEHPREKK